MSAVSSVDAGQGLYQFIQQLGAGAAASTAPAATTDATSTGTATSPGQPTQAAGGAHHRHGHGEMFSKIESAVTSALQSAQANGSSDPNKVIQDAIAKVFQNAGNASSTGSQQAGGSNPDADGDTDASGASAADASSSSAHQAFLQTLQSLGVSPQQFHADFLAAIKDAQNGQVDPAAAMKSFPPGSTVDTIG